MVIFNRNIQDWEIHIMKKSNNFFRKDPKGVSTNKVPKVIASCVAGLLAMIVAAVYLPEVPLAALLTQQEILDKTLEKTAANAEAQIEQSTQPKVEEQAVVQDVKEVDTNTAEKHVENMEGGIDLRNDPRFLADLKRLYSDEDIKRLNAPRKWVTLPNVVGLTEAQALTKMHSMGLVGRVVYEDKGKKEGICFQQEIPAGQEWNTDASIFIWIQREGKPSYEERTKEVVETPAKPEVETSTKPVEPSKQTEPAEPSQTVEQGDSNTITQSADKNQS